MNIKKLRDLQNVRRFNFERCNRYQSVAEHSYFVAMIVLDLGTEGIESREVILEAVEAALLHDAAEVVTGDIPYLVKRAMDPKEVSRLETMAYEELGIVHDVPCVFKAAFPGGKAWNLVEFADALELCMYLNEEVSSGNLRVKRIRDESLSRMGEYSDWLQSYARRKLDWLGPWPVLCKLDALKH